MSKVTWLTMIIIVLVLILAGCGQSGTAGADQPATDLKPVETGDSTIVVTDQMGREVTISGVPQRIVSLSPSNTEIAFALDLADRLVGVTEYCDYPPEAQEKEMIGDFSTPNIERIVELEPDLILASTMHEEAVTQLDLLGIPVLVIESSSLAELYTSIALVAELTGSPAVGEELIGSMKQRIEAIEAAVSVIPEAEKMRVYYEVYSDPLMSAGRKAFINEIITLAGGINIFGDLDEGYPQVSAEAVAEREPQIILFPDYHGTADLVMASMAIRPGWGNVPAVLNNMVFAVPDDIFSRPGPRIVQAVEEAAHLFYPQVFSDGGCAGCE